MKIPCNVKQGTSLVKNSSQTVEIKDKTNEKKPYLEQNISNHKLDGSNLDDSIKIFNNLISEGPIYMCSVANKHKATALHKAYWLPCLGMRPLRSLCSNALLSFAESTGQNSVKYSNACKVQVGNG